MKMLDKMGAVQAALTNNGLYAKPTRPNILGNDVGTIERRLTAAELDVSDILTRPVDRIWRDGLMHDGMVFRELMEFAMSISATYTYSVSVVSA